MGESLKVYELELKGFNGATDETDHLIKWIACSPARLPYALNILSSFMQITNVEPLPHEPSGDGVDILFREGIFNVIPGTFSGSYKDIGDLRTDDKEGIAYVVGSDGVALHIGVEPAGEGTYILDCKEGVAYLHSHGPDGDGLLISRDLHAMPDAAIEAIYTQTQTPNK